MPLTVKDSAGANQTIKHLGDFTPAAPLPVELSGANNASVIAAARFLLDATVKPLSATSVPLKNGVWVKNIGTSVVDVGGSGLTANAGFPVAAGDAPIFFAVANLNLIFVVGTSGQSIAYFAS